MRFKLKRYCFKLECGEEKEVVLHLVEECRAVIHGIVKLPNGRPVEGAVVKLFKAADCHSCNLVPVTFTFTDECGQFLFGVPAGQQFVIKVFFFEPECEDHHHECDDP